MCTEKRPCGDIVRSWSSTSQREASRDTRPARTCRFHLQPPELRGKELALLKPPSLRYCYSGPHRRLQRWPVLLVSSAFSRVLLAHQQAQFHFATTATPNSAPKPVVPQGRGTFPWASSSNIILYEFLSNFPKWNIFFPTPYPIPQLTAPLLLVLFNSAL